MLKPNNYENTAVFGEELELGGHVCKIIKVQETTSKSGKDMIVISLDIAEGKQAGYYADKYRSDTRTEKKWGCVVYQLVHDQDGNTNRGLKTFHTAVEESNPGFQVVWGDGYADCFTGKLIGGVFGKEEYVKQNGKTGFATKCMFFRSVETIRKGVDIPDTKYLDDTQKPRTNLSAADIDILSDEDLPF